MTLQDYARYRLSVFTREETCAMVAYLGYKRDMDRDGLHAEGITAALLGAAVIIALCMSMVLAQGARQAY